MKLLGYEFQEIKDRMADEQCYLFECRHCTNSFDDAVLEEDDVPQCPLCLSDDLKFDANQIDAVMQTKPDSIYSDAMCDAKADREAEL